jgi:hypothetical protein
MAKVIGVILYTHLGDGCVTGKYQENGLNPQTESLTKIKKDKSEDENAANRNTWLGKYTATWTEGNTNAVNGEVTITDAGNNGFLFEWRVGINTVFYGHGMRVSTNQLAVCYWNDETDKDLSDIFNTIKNPAS